MSEYILGRHTVELDEQGRLTIYSEDAHMSLPYDEAYALLSWLCENHRETLYQLVHDDVEPGEQSVTASSPAAIAVPEKGQGDDYAF